MSRSIKQAVGAVVFLFAALTMGQILGCSSGSSGSSGSASGASSGNPTPTSSTSSLQVAIIGTTFSNSSSAQSPTFSNSSSAHSPNFSAVHLTINKVVVVPTGMEGLADNDPGLPVIATFPTGTSVDILNLHFLPQILGTTNIPAGSYSQVRLILAANSNPINLNNYVILASNLAQKLPLTPPSAQESTLKVIGNFNVTMGAFNSIVLNFNPTDAIVVAGNSFSLNPTGIHITQVFNSFANAGAVSGVIRSPQFMSWSSATVKVVPRLAAGGFSNFTGAGFRNFSAAGFRNFSTVTSGVLFSNFSSPSVWKSNFAAVLPPNGSALMPFANYRIFVQAYRDTKSTIPVFSRYSSPLFTVTSGQITPVPPNGVVPLAP